MSSIAITSSLYYNVFTCPQFITIFLLWQSSNCFIGWNILMWPQLTKSTQFGPYAYQVALIVKRTQNLSICFLGLSLAHIYNQTYTLNNQPVASCLSRQGLTPSSSLLLSFPSQPGTEGKSKHSLLILTVLISLNPVPSLPCRPPGAPGLAVLFL